MKMHPIVKKIWLDALRSGKYKQGANALRQGYDTFCCLGVLCDVMGATWKDKAYPIARNGAKMYKLGVLSDEMLKAARLTTKVQFNLVNMNDRKHYTFDAIADYIEENL